MEIPGWLKCSNPNCNSVKGFIEDIQKGDIVCSQCGRVASEKSIDMGADWRVFEGDDDDNVRGEKVQDDGELGATHISVKSGKDKFIADKNLQKIQRTINSQQKNNFSIPQSKIENLTENMNLKSDVKQKAKIILAEFEKNKGKKKIRGSNTDEFAAAIVYKACQEKNVSRTIREISNENGLNEKQIIKMLKVLSKHLETRKSHRTLPHELVIRFCSKLDLPPNIMSRAEQIAKTVSPRLEGKNPSSIASASILMATHIMMVPCSELDIASIARISASTVRSTFRVMEQWKEDC